MNDLLFRLRNTDLSRAKIRDFSAMPPSQAARIATALYGCDLWPFTADWRHFQQFSGAAERAALSRVEYTDAVAFFGGERGIHNDSRPELRAATAKDKT